MVMPRTFEVRQEFDAPAAQVRRMMVDPAYIRRRAERTGAMSVEVEIEGADEIVGADEIEGEVESSTGGAASNGVRLQITRVLPTQGAPTFARGLLGESITVTESQAWQPVASGAVTATMEASFGSMLRLTGVIELRDADSGSVAITRATCKASVPLVGGKVESLVEQQVTEYLVYEQQVARDWLHEHGNRP